MGQLKYKENGNRELDHPTAGFGEVDKTLAPAWSSAGAFLLEDDMSLDWVFAHQRGSLVDNRTEIEKEAANYRSYMAMGEAGHKLFLSYHKHMVEDWIEKNAANAESLIDAKVELLRAVGVSEEDIAYVSGRDITETADEAAVETPKAPTGKQEAARRSASKVCGIANRLTASMGKAAAFRKAWELAKIGGVEFNVAGVTFGSRQEALKRLTAYNAADVHAYLEPEPENPVDHDAIAVTVSVNGSKNVYHLGYVPKTLTGLARSFIGKVPELKVLNGDIYGAKVRFAV